MDGGMVIDVFEYKNNATIKFNHFFFNDWVTNKFFLQLSNHVRIKEKCINFFVKSKCLPNNDEILGQSKKYFSLSL